MKILRFRPKCLFSDKLLGFVDQANGDYHIGETSVLVDAGTTNVSGMTFPATDADGNDRIVGVAIDIGPYEYALAEPDTTPVIDSFSYTGTPKVGVELTFTISATPYTGRSIASYAIDFGSGTFIPASASTFYTYSTPGSKTIRAKVTDNEGEESVISTLDLTIADLTTEEKITKAYEDGKQYVQDNLIEFGLLTINEHNQAVDELNETISTMYTQEDLDKVKGNFFVIPVKVPCLE